MLLTPVNHPFNWKQPPRLVLGLGLILTLIFVFWHQADVKREQALNNLYQHDLLSIEWPLYETHLLKGGQRHALEQLKQAHQNNDITALTQYLGTDARFVQSIEQRGAEFLPEDVFANWKEARAEFNDSQRKLSAEALGVDPQQFRLITFLTHTVINTDLLQLVGSLLLLFTAGMALELALGGGAILTSFLGSGIIGAIAYLLINGGGTLPLAGSGAAIAGVVGMFAFHFRTQHVNWLGKFPLTAVILPILWLFFLLAQFFSDQRPSVLIAQVAGFLASPLWYLAYQRWFAEHDEPSLAPVIEDTNADLEYREQLQLALDDIGRMEFVGAQKRLRELVKRYPNDLRVLGQLYHLEKLTPDSTTFDAVARRFFQLSTHTEDGAKIALPIYRDYDKISLEKRALDTETSLKLTIRFARIGEVKEADKLMKTLLARKASHALFPKAALALSQAFDQLHDPARAEQYKDLATRGATVS